MGDKILGPPSSARPERPCLYYPDTEDTEELLVDAAKNAEAYAELIQFLDDKSLLLVM